MSEKIYPVPADAKARAYVDDAKYQEMYKRSVEDPEGFWLKEAARIDWGLAPQRALDFERPPFAKWFAGGETNLCHNAVDRHLAARPDQNALIFVSTETETEALLLETHLI